MPFLELHEVQKKFGAAVAVQSFSLGIERGELVSFLGPSGCGKTTTLRMIAGFEVPTAGKILVDGADLTAVPPNRRNVGMVFQSYALFPNMTVADNIGYGLSVTRRPASEIKQRVAEMLALIKMEQFANRYPSQLSGGQQQRVALARALAMRPQVLLLDEPLSALDAKIRVSLRHEIRAIQRQLNITTIYVTHDQEEALSLSDRIVVMNDGLVEQVGPPFEIYNFPATRFVASFVGTLNVLEAELRDKQQGILAVDSQLIRTARPLNGAVPGSLLPVAIRPEAIRVVENGAAGNRLLCRVENITFLGAIVRVQVSTGRNSFYLDTFNHPHLALAGVGEQVQVSFADEAVLVLGENHRAEGTNA